MYYRNSAAGNNCSFRLILTKVHFLSVNIFIANIAAERQREIGCDQTRQKNNQYCYKSSYFTIGSVVAVWQIKQP